MTKLRLIAILAAFCLTSTRATSAAEHAVQRPDTLSADPTSPPFWISASAATAADGEVNYERFNIGLREVIRSQAIPIARGASTAAEQQPCTQFTVSYTGGPAKAMTTWRSALANAESVVKGRVTATTPGFFTTSPATILTVHIDQRVSGDWPLGEGHDIFVPYFAADFRVGGARFCNAGLSRNGGSFLPAINDEILILVFDRLRAGYLSTRDENLFFGRDDVVYAPFIFNTDTSLPRTTSFKSLVVHARDDRRVKGPERALP
jgi:hypothetical protein